MTYIAWGACLSMPVGGTDGELPADVHAYQVFGCIYLFLALGSFVRDPSIFNFGDDDETPALAETLNESGGESSGEITKKSAIIFFLIHALGSLYVITLLCHERSSTTYWAMAVSSWLMLALFGWSLIAPQVLDRDFGYH